MCLLIYTLQQQYFFTDGQLGEVSANVLPLAALEHKSGPGLQLLPVVGVPLAQDPPKIPGVATPGAARSTASGTNGRLTVPALPNAAEEFRRGPAPWRHLAVVAVQLARGPHRERGAATPSAVRSTANGTIGQNMGLARGTAGEEHRRDRGRLPWN